MRKISMPVVFLIFILLSGTVYSQDEYLTLTSPDFIKGLDSVGYLKQRLSENNFSLVRKGASDTKETGSSEYWQYKNMVFVDIISNPGGEKTIKVAVDEAFKGFPERLIESFPHKSTSTRREQIGNETIRPSSKKSNYSLVYPRDSDNVAVFIWFDDPHYYFEYKSQK